MVILGGGVAGVTAADVVRRNHPDCDIHVVNTEPHTLYNRMAISRLVHGRSAMKGLYLLPEERCDTHRVHTWLNTTAQRIDIERQQVSLVTGQSLTYDRLILAMGAEAALPPIDGLDLAGSFRLRTAADAIGMHRYAQEHGCADAVVSGAGLLGLEAAQALRLLGLRVTILERNRRLLGRQVDDQAAQLVADHFARSGIAVIPEAECRRLDGPGAVRSAVLTDGRELPCDPFLSATGIRPNTRLACDAGIPVRRGALVDDHMYTGIPGVYALGGQRTLDPRLPEVILKDVGLELFSIGQWKDGPRDEVIVVERPAAPSYRRLVISGGRVVGATVIGDHPADVVALRSAVRDRQHISAATADALRTGDFGALARTPERPAPAPDRAPDCPALP